MAHLVIASPSDQVAAHMRGELLRGKWRGEMPGTPVLAAELGVDRKTVEGGMQQLEDEGLLKPQGAGRRRLIILPEGGISDRSLRIGIFTHDPLAQTEGYILDLQYMLKEAGFNVVFSEKGLLELNMNVRRVARHVQQIDADAWVVVSASREVLEWFIGKGIPVFALFGRRRELQVAGAGPDKVRAFREVVRRLVELGHRRIVCMGLAARRLPKPGLPERTFLEELSAHGIKTGSYHMPNWEESTEGLQRILDSLFKTNPPTAMLIDEAYLFHAVRYYLAERGIRVPGQVSLVCTDPDRTFTWCSPSIAHINWNSRPVVQRIVRWVENVACGKEDLRQTATRADYVEGGTVGPVPPSAR